MLAKESGRTVYFWITAKDDGRESDHSNFEDIAENLVKWIEDYNTRAPHSSLGMKTPARFYANWKAKLGEK